MTPDNLKILAIDDNKDNLTTLKAMLMDAMPACKLSTALSGPKGIQLAQSEDPDVILLDIIMPGMDGFEVCRRLKDDENLCAIPVVFLTALRTDSDSRILALEVGGEGFLTKPLDEAELIAQIRAMAKINEANRFQRLENEELGALVAERTKELVQELAERKRVEEALRESGERLSTAVASGSIGIWGLDLRTNTLVWDERMHDIFGVPRRTVPTREMWLIAILPEDRPVVEASLERVIAEKRKDSVEFRICHPDGSIRYIYDAVGPVLDDNGEVRSVVGLDMDVTERKLTEEALRISNERLELAQRSAGAGIWDWDLVSQKIEWSRDMLLLFGLDPDTTVASFDAWHSALHPDDLEVAGIRIEQALKNRTALHSEYRVIHPNGEVRWIRALGNTEYDASGNPSRMAGICLDITERKLAEEALRESEARLKDVIFSTADWVWEVDEKGVYTYSSQKSLELLGRPPESIIGKTPFDFMDSKERKRVGAIFKKIAANKAPIVDLENWSIKENGERVCLLTNGVPILDDDRNLKGYRGVDKDITARKQAERELLLNHEMQHAMNSILRLSMEKMTDKDFLDHALKLILSLEWLEFESKGAIFIAYDTNKYLHIKAHVGFDKALLKACATVPFGRCVCGKAAETRITQFVDRVDEAHETRYKGMLPHGHYCVPILIGDHVLGLLALYVKEGHKRNPQEEQFLETVANSLATAIERRRGEEALRESEEKYRELFERMTSGLAVHEIILDDNGVPVDYRFLGVNPTFERLTGLKAQDIIGRTVRDVLPGIESTWIERYGKVVLTGDPVAFVDYSAELGCHYEVTAYRSAPDQFACVVVDVTEQKQAEEHIQRLNDELEQRVEERTAQLSMANKGLEAFSYSVSHDLRAPLRTIDGWSLLLAEDYGDQLDEQARVYIGRVRSAAQKMGQLIDDMLQLGRVGRAEITITDIDISGIAATVAARLSEANPDRDIRFEIQPDLRANGDARLLEAVLTNLLDNAVKFSGKREHAVVEFGTTNTDRGLAFLVRDNGTGFDTAHAEKLFEAFHRMKEAQAIPGAGVGLATVKRIIHRHGGEVWADAQVDEGATFYFTLAGCA